MMRVFIRFLEYIILIYYSHFKNKSLDTVRFPGQICLRSFKNDFFPSPDSNSWCPKNFLIRAKTFVSPLTRTPSCTPSGRRPTRTSSTPGLCRRSRRSRPGTTDAEFGPSHLREIFLQLAPGLGLFCSGISGPQNFLSQQWTAIELSPWGHPRDGW